MPTHRLRRRLVPAVSALVVVLVALGGSPRAQQPQKITINYPTRSGASWPMYIAKEGGYYQKYGLDADLQFGVHPTGIAMLTSGQAVMVNHSLEQGMVASSKDAASFALMGSSSNKGLFALMAQKDFTSPRQLKGKRIGLVENTKYNSDKLLLRIGDILKQEYGAAEARMWRKHNSGVPAHAEIIEEAKRTVDVVVAGIGD